MDGRGREWATPVLNNYLTTVADRGPEAGDDGAKFGPMHTDRHSLFTRLLARSIIHSLTLAGAVSVPAKRGPGIPARLLAGPAGPPIHRPPTHAILDGPCQSCSPLSQVGKLGLAARPPRPLCGPWSALEPLPIQTIWPTLPQP